MSPPLIDLCPAARELLSFCCIEKYSRGEVGSHYRLLLRVLKSEKDGDASNFEKEFPSEAAFVGYVEKSRKMTVPQQGWKFAEIRGETGLNRSGIFRSIIQLMFQELRAGGGVSSIVPFTCRIVNGRRVYSNPCDSDALRQYAENNPLQIPVVGIDLVADGTTLSRSGTQSANAMRVRFSNIKGRSKKWHEIAIAPSLDTGGQSISSTKLSKDRLELFQRFLYLMLKDVIEASTDGILFDSRHHSPNYHDNSRPKAGTPFPLPEELR